MPAIVAVLMGGVTATFGGVLRDIAQSHPGSACRVSLSDDGTLRWEDGTGKVYDTDPGAGWIERAVVRIGSRLPIDWLL